MYSLVELKAQIFDLMMKQEVYRQLISKLEKEKVSLLLKLQELERGESNVVQNR